MMEQSLYVFDMDETLINDDCAMLWNQFLVQKGIVTDPHFIEQDKRLMALYAQGQMKMEEYLTFSMAPLAGMPKDKVNAWVQECVDTLILPKQFKQSKPLIEQLKQQGTEMIIISASVTFLVQAVASRLGIQHALGIDLVEEDNAYTAQIAGVPSYREGKVKRLESWLAVQPQRYQSIHFYTDSINDLPLCEFADYVYLVNPCQQLRAYRDRENWVVLDWHS